MYNVFKVDGGFMLKKAEYIKNNLKDMDVLMCPLCYDKLMLYNNSLVCDNNHCFDISKKGYVTLLKKNKLRSNYIYDTCLFRSRYKFISKGFYNELHVLISKIIKDKVSNAIILDMGCGDGTHDNIILNLLDNKECFIIGVDISKEGILCATDYVSNNFIPLVADLNYMPIKNHCVDVILNILSPSCEREINRVLKKEGIIIKVTPRKGYLCELREIFNIKEYENEVLIEKNIANNYDIVDKYVIDRKMVLDYDDVLNLINMTPLTRNYKGNINLNEITISLNVYVLKIKK